MAFAALASLHTTIIRLFNASRISVVSSPGSNLENLQKKIISLVTFLKENSSLEIVSRRSKEEERLFAEMDRQTMEAVHEFEDALESQILSQFDDHAHSTCPMKIDIDLQQLDRDIDVFYATITRIKEDYRTQILELNSGNNDDDVWASIDFRSLVMAYDDLITLMRSFKYSFQDSSNISSLPKLELVQKDLSSLTGLVERMSSLGNNTNKQRQKVIDSLDTQIRDKTHELKKFLQCYKDNKIYTSPYQGKFISDRQEMEQEFEYIGRIISNIEKEYRTQVEEMEQEFEYIGRIISNIEKEYSTQVVGSSKTSVIKINEKYISSSIEPPSRMFGLKKLIRSLKAKLIKYGEEDDALQVHSIWGMVGSGKTTLVRHAYEDPFILRHFQSRAWVKVGPNYQFEKVMSDLVHQLSPCNNDDNELLPGAWMLQGGESSHLYKILKSKRYLIVFDDLWDTKFLKMFKKFFPEDNNRSRVVVTTRIKNVSTGYATHQMKFLNKKESWDLFCNKVFGENLSCPDELEKVAKKIVMNCEGLPLAIIVVGKHLSKFEKTPEYWTNVAEKRIPIFDSADDSYEVIFSSYKYLPLHSKACFLYTGIFPRDSKIKFHKFSRLYSADGLFQPSLNYDPEAIAKTHLQVISANSVIMVRGQSANNDITTFGVHYVFQHMIQSEARKTKLFHVINGYDESSLTAETLKSHRRICIHNNVLFGVNKDLHKSMVSISATLRSLLCTGEYHKYPVPISSTISAMESSLLRVLEARSIQFYQFPFEMLKLFRLRSLAFTYNGELPSSISRFWDLQYLIIDQHVRIVKSSTGGAPRYLPVEIWNMKELRHLHVVGSDLPNPPHTGGSLPNLTTLVDVSFHSCREEVIKGISNLKMLIIRIELGMDDVNAESLLYWCSDLSPLGQLTTLKCSIVNPNHTSRVVPSFPVLPSSVVELHLSGFGYLWKDLTRIIDPLSHLQVLGLSDYAFQGPKLELTSMFNKLKTLTIEDADLEYMGGDCDSLVHLVFWDYYKLKQIPNYFKRLLKITLIDCNPSAAESAKKTKSAKGNVPLKVKYSFSYE